MEVTSKDIQIRVGGTSVVFTEEPTTTKNNQIYEIVDKTKRVWNMNKLITITPIPEPEDKYEIDYVLGRIIFKTKKDRGDITVSGEYLPTSLVATARSHNINKVRNFVDATVYGHHDKVEIPVDKDITGSIEDLEVINTFLQEKLINGEKLLFEFQMGAHIESFWVYLENIGINANAGELMNRTINFRLAKE